MRALRFTAAVLALTAALLSGWVAAGTWAQADPTFVAAIGQTEGGGRP